MTLPTGFPSELLAQPPAVRLAYFQSKVVAHPHLKETHQRLWQALQHPTGAALLLVFGPTGVGKTTLRLRVEQQLLEAAQGKSAPSPGHMPVVGMEVAVPEAGNFRWRDYYKRALLALEEPLIEHKRQSGEGKSAPTPHVVTADLRWALEQALRHRQPAAFIVDEAQHLKKLSSGRRLLDQLDTLKSLASLSGTVHVLIGTYELLSFAHLSAQLDRRSLEIHFPRYHPDRPDDMVAFQRVLLTFQRHLPLVGEPDLLAQTEYFYERSVGCVGILKDWLTRSLATTLEAERPTLTRQILEQQALSTPKLLRLAREIREGEEALATDSRAQTELRSLLGLSVGLPAASPERAARSPVGQRNPTRDPVGIDEPSS